MWPLDLGRERADDLADRRREDVDAAHDQHVVGAADAAHARAGPPARARARPDLDVVARAEAQQRRGAVAQMGEHELARSRRPPSRPPSPVSGSISSGWTKPRAAEVHAVLVLALAPQRDADVADPHRLGDARAPARLELRAEGRLAAAGLARDAARRTTLEPARSKPRSAAHSSSVGGVGRREHDRLGPQQLDRAHQPLGVAGADRDVAEADALERGERGAGGERAGVVGRDDPLAGRDARGGVAARRARRPSCRGRRP